jgi:hypothetical protein
MLRGESIGRPTERDPFIVRGQRPPIAIFVVPCKASDAVGTFVRGLEEVEVGRTPLAIEAFVERISPLPSIEQLLSREGPDAADDNACEGEQASYDLSAHRVDHRRQGGRTDNPAATF